MKEKKRRKKDDRNRKEEEKREMRCNGNIQHDTHDLVRREKREEEEKTFSLLRCYCSSFSSSSSSRFLSSSKIERNNKIKITSTTGVVQRREGRKPNAEFLVGRYHGPPPTRYILGLLGRYINEILFKIYF